jgi:predicted amidohydrolase
VFRADDLTFGVVICYDSNYLEPARVMAAKGAAALFVPTNNAMPVARADEDLASEARACDIARAVENTVWVVRADVAGRSPTHQSQGATGVVDPHGRVVRAAQGFAEDLLIVDIDPRPSVQRAAN